VSRSPANGHFVLPVMGVARVFGLGFERRSSRGVQETLSVSADSVGSLDPHTDSVSARLRKVDLPRPLHDLAGESSAFDVDPADLVFARA
jgi:hypothetical protein